MASSSSSRPRTWRYHVFTSFHGPDVRKTFLSHLRKQFRSNGISMFDDQRIKRSQTITHALTQAIRESMIYIVVLSENYASSNWCLDELVEIFKCKEDFGQIVMTVFYGVDPSDVRKQKGDFGSIFNKTCAGKTEEERQKWSQALTEVGNIAGEHFLNWDNESNMIEKIARGVSNKLNTTVSRDFEDIVGIEAHLKKMQSLLHLDDDEEAMIVGICGPSGIGKTTIARALYSRLSSNFQLTCFMENLSGSYNRGLDKYGLKMCLQEQLLSRILNQTHMKIYNLGGIRERLSDQKVLIILDDVDNLEQLEALANETSWFGPGSKIIITTKDQQLLEKHDINNTYHVDFPTKDEARMIFCRYAFKGSLAPKGFENLVKKAVELYSNLPLVLRVTGLILRGKNQVDWESLLHRLENSIDRDIEGVFRIGYDNLHKDDQLLFLLIAFFFNYKDGHHVKTMLADSNLDVRLGLKNLAYKSLIQISTEGKIVMHKVLQQMGREAVQTQDSKKRQILIDNDEICDFLENVSGSRSVMGISFDISTLSSDVHISSEAFKRNRNIQFLNIYNSSFDIDYRLHVPENMDFPSRLKLLHWEDYPGKCLPSTFRPEYLVKLNLKSNKLEKLWDGIQPLTSLKKLSLENSVHLEELPDLSNATNLERLNMDHCHSLVEIPSSIENLQKLERLQMDFCVNLQVVPTHLNLASLDIVNMSGCCQLKKFPDIFRNIAELSITDTMLQNLPGSTRLSRLKSLYIFGNDQIMKDCIKDLLDADIENIPDWFHNIHGLEDLYIAGCPKLTSLPHLPALLKRLRVDNCESLETIMPFTYESPIESLHFTNCLKLGKKTRRVISQQSTDALLPGRNVPAEFNHRAIGNSLIIPSGTTEYRYCFVVSPKQGMKEYVDLLCRLSRNGLSEEITLLQCVPKLRTDHLVICHVKLCEELESDLLLEFSTTSKDLDIIECGFQILTDHTEMICYLFICFAYLVVILNLISDVLSYLKSTVLFSVFVRNENI